MFSFFKKLVSALVVLYLVALVLNLKVAGKPTRDWTGEIWNSRGVQKVYTTIKDRLMALIKKDISVEEVFQAKPTGSSQKPTEPAAKPKSSEGVRTINMEEFSEQDREALEKILDKSTK